MLADKLRAAAAGTSSVMFVASAQAEVNSTSLSINKPTGVVDGDLLIALICVSNLTRIWTPPAGWSTLVASTSNNDNSTSIFWKLATSEGASFSFSINAATNASGCVLAYRNASMGFSGVISSGTVDSLVLPELEIPVSGGLLVGFADRAIDFGSWNTPTGMTPVASDSSATAPSWAVFSEDRSSGLTGSREFFEPGANPHAGVMFFVYPSGYTNPPTPTFVGVASQQNTASGGSLTINRPAGTQQGDLMIAVMAGSDSLSNWTDATFTEVADQGVTSPGIRVAYKVAGASEPSSYSFTNSGVSATLSGAILSYIGAAYDAVGSLATAADPVVPNGVNSAAVFSRLIGVAVRRAGDITVTAPASMVTRLTDNGATGPSYVIADEVVGYGATGPRSFNVGSTTNVVGVLVNIKPT